MSTTSAATPIATSPTTSCVALTDGLRADADVVDVGIVPTPVAYFAQQHLLPSATVMR